MWVAVLVLLGRQLVCLVTHVRDGVRSGTPSNVLERSVHLIRRGIRPTRPMDIDIERIDRALAH